MSHNDFPDLLYFNSKIRYHDSNQKNTNLGVMPMLNKQQGLNILWVTVTHTLKGTRVKPHTHEYYHLTHVNNGTLIYDVDGTVYHVEAGMTMLVPPGVSHAQEGVVEDLAIASEIKFVLTDSTLSGMLESAPILIPSSTEAVGLIDLIVAESVRLSAVSQDCIHSYLNAVLHLWAREYYRDDKEENFHSIFDTSGFSPLTISILNYLEMNYASNVNLQALADKLGYNKYYICNVFKKETGITIFDCLALIRVHHAAELISYSEMSLENVGSSVGFSSISHFNRVFKQIAGVPPGQYRRHYPAEILTVEHTEMNLDRAAYADLIKKDYAEPFIVSVLARQKISGDMLNQIIKKTSDDT